MKDGHAPDLWHLTIDDLLTPPPETPRLGGSGPFVINLSSSTAPIAIPTEKFPGFEQLRLYQVKRTENNRWRYRLRVGLINTELEADAILAVARERYPSAFTATAGDDDLKAVSEASRTAQARRAHATEMIADKPEEDAEPARKAAEPRRATATIAKPASTVAKPVAPAAQAPQPMRWIIMQAPEKKTPPPRDEADVDPNAVTDQVAILKLPDDEPAAELTLDDVVPPTAPKTEPPKKADPPKAEAPKAEAPKAELPKAEPLKTKELPKKVEANKPEPPKATVSPPKFTPRPMKEIEAELRPLFEPTRKAPPAPATVNDLQAIADLVVIDHSDTLESVVLKNNAMVDSLIVTGTASTDAAPVAEPGILETEVPDIMALMAAPMAPPAPAAQPAAVAHPAPVVAQASPIDLVPELTLEITDLAITPPAVAAPSLPVVIEAELEALPVLTEAVPVVSKTRAPVVEPSKQVSEPRATVSAPVAKAKAREPVKVVEPPVLTAAVVEAPKKAAEPKHFVEFSAQTAKVIEAPQKVVEPPTAKAVEPAKVVEPVAKVSEPVKVSAPAPKIFEPAAKVIEAPRAVESAKPVEAVNVVAPSKVVEAAKVPEPLAKTLQPPRVSALVAKAFERAKVEAVAQATEPAKVVAPVAKVAEPPKVVEPVAKSAEPASVAESVAKSAEPASVAESVAKTAEPAKPVEPPRTVKAQLIAKAGAKSHRAIAKLAKAAAKQSKAINRTTKEIAKATKGQVSQAPHSKPVDEKPGEHTQTVAVLKPIEPTESIEQAPPPATAAAPVVAQPPKPEQHASKQAARSSKHVAHTAKSAIHAPKGSHAHKANGHGGVNGHNRHANGAARDLNDHAHAPKSSPPPPKAAAPALNGHAHAAAKHPAVSGQPQALNGHSPAAKESAPTANNRVTVATPPVAPPVAKQTVAQPEPAPVQKVVEILSEPLPPVDSTQTIRALTPLELADDDDGSRWYSIQLSLSEDEINPESVPHLDIFDEYRLYSVAGLEQGKFMHALRLGFFTSEGAAQAVAGYLKCYFDEPSVKRVAIAERERFAERRLVARKDIGATGTHTIIELATAPPVPETTLADLSQTGVRRMPEDGSLLSRLFSQLKR